MLFDGHNFLRLLQGLWVTLSIALSAMAISVVLGTLLGIVMTSRNRAVQLLTRLYLEFVRIMPQLVLLFVVYFSLSTSAGINLGGRTAAAIVFVIWGTAEMGDLVRGAIGSIPRHQRDSALALGLTSSQAMRRVILPQTMRRLLPLAMNLTARMVMTTSLVVLIGVVEVLKTGQQIIDANRFTHPDAALWVYGAIFALYFLACWPLSLLSRHLEKKWKN
ncbi:ABC-type amino acid transport system, permease component [Luteococcus japonicus LSP_Lj1]|uniref:ABC-type amino acid transport system, permease component n=1 Tax=Luteococcus japonicus LSP_Lj1 TaxID=1255658 RepID=A0A1R4IH14_9ACTN|nr:ABC-type amino acid transport system, permease component [Luteococcus japonicus LSP_Lj1]